MSSSESNSGQAQEPECRSLDGTTQLQQSPTDIVPDDIWSEIFQRVCQNSLAEYQKWGREPPIPLSPYTLSHVCRHWQYLAISQPNLWTNIFVFEHTKSPYSLHTTSLQRTGSLKLSIWIIAKDSWRFDTFKFATCLEELTNVSSRWISLLLALGDCGKSVALEFFNRNGSSVQKSKDFSSLHRIEATLPQGDRIPRVSDEYQFIQDLFRDCPTFNPSTIQLSSWHPIYGDVLRSNQPSSSALWTSVVSLICHRQYLARMYLLFPHLGTMPQLENLEFDTCFLMPVYHPPQNRPTLHKLKRLSILNMDDDLAAKTIFDHLLLPNLEEINMSPKFHFRAFREMAETSQCTPHRLSITIKPTSVIADELFFLLASSAFLSLRELTIRGEVLDEEIVDCFEMAPPPQEILQDEEDLNMPVMISEVRKLENTGGLTHLTLIGCSTPDGQLGHLGKSRMLNGSLRYFHVETMTGVEEAHAEDYKMFRELQHLGFDVDLRRISQSQ